MPQTLRRLSRAAPAYSQRPDPPRRQPAKDGRSSLIQALSNALGGADEPNVRNRQAQRVDDANIRNLESQFLPQFQQLLYVELALLRRVCNVDAKPFVEVAKAAKAGLRVTVREYVVAQNARMRGRIEGVSATIDPRSQVQRLLAPLVQSKLGPEQAQRYRQECGKRAESRKRTVVLNLIAALDERLVLTAEQRARLVHSLSANYQSAWDQYLQMFSFNVQYLPSIDDESIVPLLNERQKSVWQEIPKQHTQVFFGIQIARAGIAGESAEIQEIARIVEEVQDDR